MLRHLLLLTLVVASSACTTIASYDIDEAELESRVQQSVKAFDQQQADAGSPFSVSLDEIHIDVGPEDRDVIVVDARGNAAINAIITQIPVDIAMTVEGAPTYSSKDKAIYIKRLKLIKSNVSSPLFKGDSQPVSDALMVMLGQLLETTPVYRLDESDPKQLLLSKMPIDIVVGRGKLMIVPARE